MEVEGGRFVCLSVGIEDKPAGDRAHDLTEQLRPSEDARDVGIAARGCTCGGTPPVQTRQRLALQPAA